MIEVNDRRCKYWYNKLPVSKGDQVVYKLYDLTLKYQKRVSG
jgi:hypothetical protein